MRNLVLLLLFSISANAQPVLSWAKQFRSHSGNAPVGRGMTIAADKAGNILSGGWFNDSLDTDPGTPVFEFWDGSRGSYVSKLDPAGNFVWAAAITGCYCTIVTVLADDSNNVYVAGYFNGQADFDPGPGTYILTSSSIDFFAWKLSPSGNLVWVKQVGGTQVDKVTRMCSDKNGNLYLMGEFNDSVDFDPGPNTYYMTSSPSLETYILKLSANGNFNWAVHFDRSQLTNMSPLDIAADQWSNVYLVGTFEAPGTVDFDPGPGQVNIFPTGLSDGFIVKLNASGNYVWAEKVGYLDYDTYREVNIAPGGEINLFGYFSYAADLDPGPGVANYTSTGGADPFLCQLDTAGNLIWLSQFGGAPISNSSGTVAIATAGDGRIFVTGQFDDGTDWDPGPGVVSFSSNSYEITLSSFDNNGALLWAGILPGDDWNCGFSICTDNTASIAFTGSFQGLLDCDPGNGTTSLSAQFFEDVVICKYYVSPNGVEEIQQEDGISFYPNPAHDFIEIRSQQALRSVTIYDLTGRICFAEEQTGQSTRFRQLSLPVPAGAYIISCRLEDGTYVSKKVIVQQE